MARSISGGAFGVRHPGWRSLAVASMPPFNTCLYVESRPGRAAVPRAVNGLHSRDGDSAHATHPGHVLFVRSCGDESDDFFQHQHCGASGEHPPSHVCVRVDRDESDANSNIFYSIKNSMIK